jgi:hypothetical protein
MYSTTERQGDAARFRIQSRELTVILVNSCPPWIVAVKECSSINFKFIGEHLNSIREEAAGIYEHET